MIERVLQGPFLTRTQAARRAGVAKHVLPDRPDLLHLGGEFLEEVYFDFQFNGHGVRPDVGHVVSALRHRCSDEAIADWLVRSNTQLNGSSPLSVLDGTRSVDRVLRAARLDGPVPDPSDLGPAMDQVPPLPEGDLATRGAFRPGRPGRAAPRRRSASPHPA